MSPQTGVCQQQTTATTTEDIKHFNDIQALINVISWMEI